MTTNVIRAYSNAKFAELLPTRAEVGNTKFRAAVMQAIVAEHGCSVASAATHYNFSFKEMKANSPELVKGLGRAEDKKGGRKVSHPVDVIKVKDGSIVATGLSKAAAEALVAKAEQSRKAKLAIKVPEVVVITAAEGAGFAAATEEAVAA